MTELSHIEADITGYSLFNGRIGTLKSIAENHIQKNLSEDDKIGLSKAARGFESIFINMMIKEMKNAMLEKRSDEMTFGADTLFEYGDLMMSDDISNSGKGIGIASFIYKQMTGEELKPITRNVAIKQHFNIKPGFAFQNKKTLNEADEISKKVSSVADRVSKFDEIINAAAAKYNVSENLIKAIIAVESAGNPAAISNAGAKGLMQLMDSTAKDLGVNNSYDSQENIFGGTLYLRQMMDRFDGNLELVLAAYNAGPGNVEKYNGIPPFNETQSYIKKVQRYNKMFNNMNI